MVEKNPWAFELKNIKGPCI